MLHFLYQKASTDRRPVWYVFAGMGTQWYGMGRKMMDIDVFKASILKSDTVLKPLGVQLYQLLMDGDEYALADIVNSFVGIVAIQVKLLVHSDCYYLSKKYMFRLFPMNRFLPIRIGSRETQ